MSALLDRTLALFPLDHRQVIVPSASLDASMDARLRLAIMLSSALV